LLYQRGKRGRVRFLGCDVDHAALRLQHYCVRAISTRPAHYLFLGARMASVPPPIILTVDDDPEVSRSLARDLRQRYGEDYRIRRAESGSEALDTLKELKLRDEQVGLLLADHRMPEMTGVEFLEQSRQLYPKARRVLLTAYADTDAAIGAINRADVDYYLLKPWDPPQEKLFPVLDDLLEDWKSHARA